MSETLKKISALENALMQVAYAQRKTDINLSQLSTEMKDFKSEMKDFKSEMKDFKDEMKDFKDEMKDFKDEMKDFKDEMKDFKDEMKDFKDETKDFKDEMIIFRKESQTDRKSMNKQWGDLANKLGTIVEDIVAPSLPRILKTYFTCETIDFLAVRVIRRQPADASKQREFDGLAVSGDRVFVNETKSTVRDNYLHNYVDFLTSGDFFRYFPEYEGKILIPFFSSLHIPEDKLSYLSRNGIYALTMSDSSMDVVNFDACQSKVGKYPSE